MALSGSTDRTRADSTVVEKNVDIAGMSTIKTGVVRQWTTHSPERMTDTREKKGMDALVCIKIGTGQLHSGQ